jgi:hypothetical protein
MRYVEPGATVPQKISKGLEPPLETVEPKLQERSIRLNYSISFRSGRCRSVRLRIFSPLRC